MPRDWQLGVDATCERLLDQELTCMVCVDAPAVGHTRVSGGAFHGRLLLVHCATCVPLVDDGLALDRIKTVLIELAKVGLLDVTTGGPGLAGEPVLIHGDHADPWPAYPDSL